MAKFENHCQLTLGTINISKLYKPNQNGKNDNSVLHENQREKCRHAGCSDN